MYKLLTVILVLALVFAVTVPAYAANSKHLHLDKENAKIYGVCAGLAEYFGIDVTIVRAVFVVSMIAGGAGGLVYVVLAWLMPAN